ncbi:MULTISPECIES: phosphate/phosphite/phosphonate ABC transporter substrate-binding protein [Marichromatium]|uniref:Phosphonate transport system substrate-binding protein n=1 Tax=Marichromatium gracile TaxID=1048 RepID=A0A4R4ABF0_MARGR|nr:phosphate/phosphite/phosphonate ABC transporter substrate-binding protein [Marichromatium gracile]MBK1710453.1 phosphate ABC transporter substrate-binding protein [Marichromatium gracile]TCW36338.1 phosphonate transport system substrate-binding protein [Marichromatium gracile]
MLTLFVAPLAASATELSFGIVPQQSASTLARAWVPLLEALGARAGVALRFETAADIPTFERRLAQGEYDLAYMNPYHYTVFARDPGYRALARAEGRLRGVLVVRADSPLREVGSLQGATLAFPAPAAFAASVLIRAELAQRGIAFTPRYVASHDSVYRTVSVGLYPAGGGVVRTLEALDPPRRAELRVLMTTQGYTRHAFASHPRVAPEVVARVREAMLGLAADAEGRALIETLGMPRLVAAEDGDWDDVRALGIDLLDDLRAEAP